MDPPEPFPINVEHFMTNNEKLPQALLEDVQRGLAKPKRELACLEEEIQKIRDHLTQLEIKREKVEDYIAQFDCVLSPLRRVPTDILHHIFYHCLPTRHDPVMSINEAPLLLTRVCRTWRQTAHRSPALWARLYITFSDEDIISEPDASGVTDHGAVSEMLRLRCDAVEEWFSRSGACPLSISLCYTSHVWGSNTTRAPGESENTQSLFRILAQFSTRWKKLELWMPIEVYRLFEKAIPLSQIQMLDSVKASFHRHIDTWTQVSEDQTAITLLQAPNLKRVSLSSYPTLVKTIFSTPNLSKLTSISLGSMLPASEAISLLQVCPNTEYAMLNLTSDFLQVQHSTSASTTHNVISLPRLRALVIADSLNRGPGDRIYERLDAPLLEWINYTKDTGFNDPNEPLRNPAAVCALLRRSTNLKRLAIEANTLSTSELRTILQSAQSVTHLTFGPKMRHERSSLPHLYPRTMTGPGTSWKFGDLFLEGSEGDGEGHGFASEFALLPHLEALELSQYNAGTFVTDQILMDVILSRMALFSSGQAALLKKVAVVLSQEKRIDISEELSTRFQGDEVPELRLEYLHQPSSQSLRFLSLSPTYNINPQNDCSWDYSLDFEEEVRKPFAVVKYATDFVELNR